VDSHYDLVAAKPSTQDRHDPYLVLSQ